MSNDRIDAFGELTGGVRLQGVKQQGCNKDKVEFDVLSGMQDRTDE